MIAQAQAPVVEKLKTILAQNPELKTALEGTLKAAVTQAKKYLNAELYHAIDHVFQCNGWPTTADAYLDYIDVYVRLIPNESNAPNFPNAWKSDGTKNGYNQKVYDLLCQSYWLIDQNIPGTDKTLQSFEVFSDWLVSFANSWGYFWIQKHL